jgi:N-formylglutamate amidohydrolase
MTVFTVQSSEAETLPLIFDSPHSGCAYPDDFDFSCDFSILRQAEDTYVDDIFACAPAYGASLLAAQFPRSYIDVNRALCDIDTDLLDENGWPEALYGEINPTVRADAGIGLIRRLVRPGIPVYSRPLSAQEIHQRIERYYRPYHQKLAELIDQAHYNFGEVWHINCHSMPDSAASPRMPLGIIGRNAARTADFVLGDRDGSTCNVHFTHMIREFLKAKGYKVTINDPFKGVELVRRYSNPARGRHSLQIEINKSLYMDEASGKKNKNFNILQKDIENLVAFIAAYCRAALIPKAAD